MRRTITARHHAGGRVGDLGRRSSATSSSTHPPKPGAVVVGQRRRRARRRGRSASRPRSGACRRRAGMASRLAARIVSTHSSGLHDQPQRARRRLDEAQLAGTRRRHVERGRRPERRPCAPTSAPPTVRLPPVVERRRRGGRPRPARHRTPSRVRSTSTNSGVAAVVSTPTTAADRSPADASASVAGERRPTSGWYAVLSKRISVRWRAAASEVELGAEGVDQAVRDRQRGAGGRAGAVDDGHDDRTDAERRQQAAGPPRAASMAICSTSARRVVVGRPGRAPPSDRAGRRHRRRRAPSPRRRRGPATGTGSAGDRRGTAMR